MHDIVYVDSARGIHQDADACACADTRTRPAMAGELELQLELKETSVTLPAPRGAANLDSDSSDLGSIMDSCAAPHRVKCKSHFGG